jgi:hypothetical protein
MDKLKEVIAYFLKFYPNKKELSNARLTKLIYLTDWHQAINYHTQITTIKWYFDNYGPFVQDIYKKTLEFNDLFDIKTLTNIYGTDKKIFILKNQSYQPTLTDDESKSINHIINVTQNLNWNDFIRLVYSTYPIVSSERYNYLDLVKKAKEYSNQRM